MKAEEWGAATLLGITVVSLVLLLGLAGATATRLSSLKVQAQTAADAAALAAAVATHSGPDPAAEARRYAVANGARLVRCACRFDPTPRPRRVGVEVMIPVEVPLFGEVRVAAQAGAEYVPPQLEFP